MKKTILFFVISISSHLLSAQKLVTNYYDWGRQHISQQYYVNGAGEKNGNYKEYNQQGVLMLDYNFLNGLENGPCSEYFYSFAKHYLRSTVTYKNGVFNGPAVFYDDKGIPQQKGNNVNGKKEGKWTAIYPMDDPDLGVLPSDCKYLKSILEYKNDELVDGYVKVYYNPSGKLYREFYMKKGEDSGEGTSYYPNGNLKGKNQKDSNKINFTTKESYYLNGKLQSYTEFSEIPWGYTKDGYPINRIIFEKRSTNGTLLSLQTEEDWIDLSENGNPTYEMKEGPFNGPWKGERSLDTELTKVKPYQDKLYEILSKDVGYWIHIADSLNAINNVSAANELVYFAWVAYPMNKEIKSKYTIVKQIKADQKVKSLKEEGEKETASLMESANKHFDTKDYKKAKEEYSELLTKGNNLIAAERIAAIDSIANYEVQKSNLLTNQSKDILELHEKFASNFATKKAVPFFVDQSGKPIMKDYYPKGETLYRKAEENINQQIAEYNSATEIDKKFAKGKVITAFINKLISLNESDAKEVDKKMKKASDNEEVKRILEQL